MTDYSREPTNVVPLIASKKSPSPAALSQIEAYWHALKPMDSLPRRSEIDPRGIDGALEYAFILERIAPGIARFRVAGQHICELMGMEVRGMPLTSLFEADAREAVASHLEEVFTGPAILDVPLRLGRGGGAPSVRMIMLPLLGEDGRVSRVLGGVAANRQAPRGSMRRLSLDDAPLRRTQLHVEVLAEPRYAGFADPEAEFLRAPRRSRRPQLTVIPKDGDR